MDFIVVVLLVGVVLVLHLRVGGRGQHLRKGRPIGGIVDGAGTVEGAAEPRTQACGGIPQLLVLQDDAVAELVRRRKARLILGIGFRYQPISQ